jgi:ketosteroid isomerase-like protein
MTHPARAAAAASMSAVSHGAKDEWLALFAEDAVLEDPVGPSFFDPTGDGHRGHLRVLGQGDRARPTDRVSPPLRNFDAVVAFQRMAGVPG